jgi:hypothetical protein
MNRAHEDRRLAQFHSVAPQITRDLGRGPPMMPRAVDRTPCPRCGIRADLGCAHAVPSWVWAIVDLSRGVAA